ncbi:MAG: trimethylamine corrinoid protein [Methanolobus sp.]|nr:trimethylamine corrinoid protein [Methanolobus sp.]
MEFDDRAATEVAGEALDAGISPAELIEDGYTAAMNEIGELFAKGRIFLPHVIAASEAMQGAIKTLTPELEKTSARTRSRGTIVIGTIEGDIHSIGKDIVATMLRIAGYQVFDLGRDVPIISYVEKAKEVKADIVASSALMSITMINQIQVEEQLKEAGLRTNLKTMVGGAPVTLEWARRIGADIYAENAGDAVNKVNALFRDKDLSDPGR